jgi:hypothetical protein
MDRDTVIYIASNESTIPATLMSRKLANITFNLPVDMPPALSTLAETVWQSRSGAYQTSDGRQLNISRDKGTLVVNTSDPGLFAVLCKKLPADVADDVTARTQAFIKSGGPTDSGDHPNWQRLLELNGALRSATLLGVTTDREDPVAWIDAQFEKSRKFVELIWGPRELAGVGASNTTPTFRYYPESPKQFFSYDLAAGTVQHLSFDQRGRLRIGTLELSAHPRS